MQIIAANKSITIPGCQLHRNGLVIDGNLSDDLIQVIASTLLAVEHSALWWWGDFLCSVEKNFGSHYDKALEISSYSYSTLTDAKWVCSKIGFSYRQEKLSYSHHYVALVECDGSFDQTIALLAKAAENGWSVSEMRKRHRIANAEHKEKNADAGGFNPIEWVEKGRRYWLAQGDPKTWEPARRVAFVEDFSWVVRILEAIR